MGNKVNEIERLASVMPMWVAEYVLCDDKASRTEKVAAVETMLATEILVSFGRV